MSLGLCCHWLDSQGNNLLKCSSLQLGRFRAGKYDEKRIRNTYLQNVERLEQALSWIAASGIRVFRISSSLFPLWDKVPQEYWDNAEVRNLMHRVGIKAKRHNIRLGMHPSQFVVLSSPDENKRNNAMREIRFAAWQMRMFGASGPCINVHGGGKATPEREAQLIKSIEELGDAGKMLTLENCEFGWSVVNLLMVHLETKTPIVFDCHHHKFKTGALDGKTALEAACATWPEGIKPLTHISNSPPNLPEDAPNTQV